MFHVPGDAPQAELQISLGIVQTLEKWRLRVCAPISRPRAQVPLQVVMWEVMPGSMAGSGN